jgi:hypothetical protein
MVGDYRMPVKSGMEGCDKKVLKRGQSPFLDPGSHGQIPRRSLNALTALKGVRALFFYPWSEITECLSNPAWKAATKKY